MQYSQTAELNSEATLNCNGKDFKCVNSTHYQSCSLVERNGQPPQYSISGVVLPCSSGVACNDENTVNCAVQRQQSVQEVVNSAPSEIPVKVTVVDDTPVAVDAVKSVEPEVVPNDASAAKSLPVETAETKSAEVPASPAVAAESNAAKEQPSSAPSDEASVPPSAGKGEYS